MEISQAEFESVFRATYPRLLRSSELLLGDREAAEDVAQEAFARLLVRLPMEAERAERWVFKVARNLAVSRMRQVKRLRPLSEAAELDSWEVADERERQLRVLRRAIEDLPRRQREVLALRLYAELPYEQIARALGRTLGAVKQDLHRARLSLKARFNGMDVEGADAW
jgi:RNA polymerase sigma-70 factor (ECF subfamily)